MKRAAIIIGILSLSLACCGEAYDTPFPMEKIVEWRCPARDFSIADYGAKADGSKCTAAFAQAVAAASSAGGGRVVVPAGEWFTGPIHLRSNVELHLDDRAKVVFSDDPADCLPPVRTSWSAIECLNYSPLVYAFGATNVAVTGGGVFAPKMDTWERWFARPKAHMEGFGVLYRWGDTDEPVENRDITKVPGANLRPPLMQFNRCRYVRLEGFRVRESPLWTVHLLHSADAVIRGLDLRASGRNSDGIDIESTRNVLVENCRLEQGDDGFVIKSGRDRDGRRRGVPTENVLIRNCEVAGQTHTMIGVGTEVSGGIRNICLQDCWSGSCHCLFRVKTSRRKGGYIRNVHFRRIRANYTDSLLELQTTQEYQWRNIPSREMTVLTDIDGVYLKDVVCGATRRAFDLRGDPQRPARNFVLENVDPGVRDDVPDVIENVRGSRDGRPLACIPAARGAAELTISADRESRLYPLASNAVVTVTATAGGAPLRTGRVKVRVTNDGGKEVLSETVRDLGAGNPFTVPVGMRKPGFAYVEATLVDGKARAAANLGFEVEGVRAATPEPADFDAWWAGQFAEQAKLKDAVELRPIACPKLDGRFDYFLVKAKTIAAEGCVYGFLGVPKGAKGRLPCFVIVQCAGAGYVEPETNFVRTDMMTLTMNVHPLDPTLPDFRERYDRANREQGAYMYRGCERRETSYFRNAVLGCKAAVDYVLARPDCSGELLYLGSSQGGGFGLILGGIYGTRFTALCIQVPAMTDLFGGDIGRSDGWPQFGAKTASREMAYYDALYWAKRVKSPVDFRIGMMDRTCPASCTMATYNAIPRNVPKFLSIGPEWKHAVDWKGTHLGYGFIQNFLDPANRTPYRDYWK